MIKIYWVCLNSIVRHVLTYLNERMLKANVCVLTLNLLV